MVSVQPSLTDDEAFIIQKYRQLIPQFMSLYIQPSLHIHLKIASSEIFTGWILHITRVSLYCCSTG